MAVTCASEIAAAACHRAAAALRTVRRAVVRRSDAWLYGLDQEYPEYDAYHRRPRRLGRKVRKITLTAESVTAVAVSLCGVLANRWAQRPSSDTHRAAPHRPPAAPMPRAHVDGRVHVDGRAHRVQLGDRDPVPRTDSSNSPGSDVSDPPGSSPDPARVDTPSPPAAPPGAAYVLSTATITDTRHTSAIPSTFAPGAA
jgi:hypothetical protein